MKMSRARAMAALGEQTEYHQGNMQGLRRHYHGAHVGTEKEHLKWMELLSDPDESRQERSRGYRDGFTGTNPDESPLAQLPQL